MGNKARSLAAKHTHLRPPLLRLAATVEVIRSTLVCASWQLCEDGVHDFGTFEHRLGSGIGLNSSPLVPKSLDLARESLDVMCQRKKFVRLQSAGLPFSMSPGPVQSLICLPLGAIRRKSLSMSDLLAIWRASTASF